MRFEETRKKTSNTKLDFEEICGIFEHSLTIFFGSVFLITIGVFNL